MKLLHVNMTDFEPEESTPAREKIISGNPSFRTWSADETDDGVYAGIWESNPGKWLISYDEWEFCHILSGHSIITDEAGNETVVRSGDSFVLRPGFKGSWEVIETTRKHYVIHMPPEVV